MRRAMPHLRIEESVDVRTIVILGLVITVACFTERLVLDPGDGFDVELVLATKTHYAVMDVQDNYRRPDRYTPPVQHEADFHMAI